MLPLLLFCVVWCIAAQEINDDVCPTNKPTFVAHPYSCTKYYQCQNKKPVLKSCTQGKQFNPNREKCQTATEVCAFNPYNYGSCKAVMCFLTVLRNFKPADFDGRHCSHILVYDSLLSLDPESKAEPNVTLIEEIMDLKKTNPSLKIILSLRRKSAVFKFLSNSNTLDFVRKEISKLRKHNFDGINYFFIWPSLNDKNLYTDLLKTSMELFENEASESNRSRLILSHWMDGKQKSGYEIDLINKYVDFSLLYLTDYWGFWFGITGSGAPLVKNESVDFFLNGGHSPEKIIAQIPSFYRSFKLSDPSKHGFGAATSGYGVSPIDGSSGEKYFDVCKLEKLDGVVVVNDTNMGSYLYKDDFWLSYDDPQTLESKIKLTVSKHLGGIVLTSINYDDHQGTECGKGKYPWTKSALKICQNI